VDVIDAKSLERTKSIPVDGSVHNILLLPMASTRSAAPSKIKPRTVIDLDGEKAAWEVKFDRGRAPHGVRSKSRTGSTRRIFVNLRFERFCRRSMPSRKRGCSHPLPDPTQRLRQWPKNAWAPSHGIGVAPDGKSLWVNSTVANAIFKVFFARSPTRRLLSAASAATGESRGYRAVPEWNHVHAGQPASV